MDKQVDKESLAKMSTLQKGYIDQGDQDNFDQIMAVKGVVDVHTQEIERLKVTVEDNSMKIDTLISNSLPPVIGELSGDDTVFKEVKGDAQGLLKYWVPVLIYIDKDNVSTLNDTPILTYKCRKLRRSNWLRFEDGSFAPVVGITREQYNDFMDNEIVRVMEDGTEGKRYPAGSFDAAYEWEEWKRYHGYIGKNDGAMEQYTPELVESVSDTLWKYYKVDPDTGDLVFLTHILRPWETAENCFTIGVANTNTLYLLDGWGNEDGNKFRGIFFSPGIYDSQDYSEWELPPTAISPGPITTIIDEQGSIVARNFFYLFSGTTNCQSDKGRLSENPYYEADRTYPRVVDVNQITNMRYARSNNPNPTEAYPCAEGGYHALNTFITAIELAAGTKYIHQANLFGSGISTNDNPVESTNILQNGGIRFRPSEDSLADTDPGVDYPYVYIDWGGSSNYGRMSYDESCSNTHMSDLWASDYPLEQCLESQMALSMAVELRVEPLTIPDWVVNGTIDPISYTEKKSFTFYGNKYYYMTVPGFESPLEGSMNARVYKIVGYRSTLRYPKPFNAYLTKKMDGTYVNAPCEFIITAIYRFSLFNGVNLCGDISVYHGGGLEIVGIPSGEPGIQVSISGYAAPKQFLWDFTTNCDSKKPFSFMNTYQKVLNSVYFGDNQYAAERNGYTPWRTAETYTMLRGECYYQWGKKTYISDSYLRFRSLLRSKASYGCSSPRTFSPIGYASDTSYAYSGSMQVLVKFVKYLPV